MPSLSASRAQRSDEVSAEPKPVVRVLLPTEPSCLPSPSKAEVHQPSLPIELSQLPSPFRGIWIFIARWAKIYHLLLLIELSCIPSIFRKRVHHPELPVEPNYFHWPFIDQSITLPCAEISSTALSSSIRFDQSEIPSTMPLWANQSWRFIIWNHFNYSLDPNQPWLPLIWNIFNWLYEQIYFWLPHDLSYTLLPFWSESSHLSASRALTIIQELNSLNSFFSWAIFHLHIITVSVSPLLNKDLLSRTSTFQLMFENDRWFKLLLYETRYHLNRAPMYASLLSNATP